MVKLIQYLVGWVKRKRHMHKGTAKMKRSQSFNRCSSNNYNGILQLKKTYILKVETPSNNDKDSLSIKKGSCG